ncbi:hypothetical protein WA556_002804 [Blastocystis sp. ATCC 50177/Nand II]
METRRKRVIGLVGGICSGKSTVSSILKEKGCHCIDCDKIGHRVYEPHSVGFDRIVATFGEGVVAEDGSIDRHKLGSIVFSSPAEMKKLTDITWPLIHDAALQEIEQ